MVRGCAVLLVVFWSLLVHAQIAGDRAPQAPEKDGALQGQIVDPAGAAIQAFVLVHSDRWNKINKQIPVSKYGEFQVQLAPGLYDFFVASPGFLPIARVIEIKSAKPTSLKLTMKIDEEHLQATGIS